MGLLAALERSEQSELLATYLSQKFLRAFAQVKRGEYSALFAAVLRAELEFYA